MTGSCLRRAHLSVVLLVSATACETFETSYFEDKVNRATHQQVVSRYGPPHQVQNPSPDREVWTYFDRGSGMSGYTGYGRVQPCSEYHLGFDPDGILREWEVVSCPR